MPAPSPPRGSGRKSVPRRNSSSHASSLVLIPPQPAIDRTHRAGDVHDTSPLLRLHAREEAVRELAMAREVERERLAPLLLGRVLAEGAAAARVVHEDIDRAERSLALPREGIDVVLGEGLVGH